MPLSEEAFAGLRAAIECDPNGGLVLLSARREMPAAVKHKDDYPYGPIHVVLNESLYRPAFPEVKLPLCKVFGDEWLRREFTKRELANAVEHILNNLATTTQLPDRAIAS